jgi:hypothetical protein
MLIFVLSSIPAMMLYKDEEAFWMILVTHAAHIITVSVHVKT